MKSNKQRRVEILGHRKARTEASAARTPKDPRGIGVGANAGGTAPCNPLLLAPSNSYGVPAFVARGHYVDQPFTCVGCRNEEVWRATQQKWWYEVAKGNVESGAIRCRNCRRAERERRDEARRVHLEGVGKKQARNQAR
jgi:hypothetical protein